MKLWLVIAVVVAIIQCHEVFGCGGGSRRRGGGGNGGGSGNCFETWSRCSRWSSGGTGILWKSCNDRCKELGNSGGRCQLCPSNCRLSNKAWQCRCNGAPNC